MSDGHAPISFEECLEEDVEALAARIEITRIADITGLDDLGVPTAIAVRPAAQNMAVSPGKGPNLEIAKTAAVMEAAETWHTEHCDLETVRGTPADLRPAYDMTLLPAKNPDAFSLNRAMDWISAANLVTGNDEYVPRSLVEMSWHVICDPFRPFLANSNGLAAHRTYTDAALHGLYEVVERDSTARIRSPVADECKRVDLATVSEPISAELIDRIKSKGVWVNVFTASALIECYTFIAYLWSPDFPVLIGGTASHLNPATALYGALSEAAQSRLTAIAGTRDDIPAWVYDRDPDESAPITPAKPVSETIDHRALPDLSSGDTRGDLATLCELLARKGRQPLIVDLSREDVGVSVLKVIVPGLRQGNLHSLPRLN